tara:strand:- start:158 stop:343 length:186 start_codon:yes stop_codon:yes gene_type:complete
MSTLPVLKSLKGKKNFELSVSFYFLDVRVVLDLISWGCSSAGRAPALQAGGQEFEPPQLHH